MECNGSGIRVGLGMMKNECVNCDGLGKLPEIIEPIVRIDKRKKSYKKAIDELQNKYPDMSMNQVEVLFEQEFNRIT